MIEQNLIPFAALDALSDAVVINDMQSGKLWVNSTFCQRVGIAFDQVDPVTTEIKSILRQALATPGTQWDGRLPVANGQSIPITLSLSDLPGQNGLSALRMGVAPLVNVSRDALTGLPVRPFLIDRIEHSSLSQKRHGGAVVLMTLGLDRFTLVNDAHGIEAGDQLLVMAADRLRTNLRTTDSAFRLDGDKFAILLTVATTDDVIIVADKVLEAMRQPYSLNGHEVLITCSIGIATSPADTDDASQLITIAENSLHHAKQAGRNQYRFFSRDMNGKALDRFTLAARIRRAITQNEFLVYYQPKVRSDDNSIIGAEALARWKDPDYGLIQPDDFIPVAEETGLIEDIGYCILRLCCHQGRKWMDAGFEHMVLSCNISPRQFRNPDFVTHVAKALDETGLPAQWLELEINESSINSDPTQAIQKMAELRQLGLGLSLAGFGKANSSLST